MNNFEAAKKTPDDFAKDYELGRLPVMRELERSVLGCDYGGTSWTTRREAGEVAKLLDLAPQVQLLELGAGSGWPGLLLAELTGCHVVLTDLPFIGLQIAAARAAADGLAQHCDAVMADGAALPFKDGSFDALSHSDVLCCMPAKLAMLRACRRVARADAKMAFSVIAPTPALSDADRRIAVGAGPPYVDVDGDYALLLRQSGWRVLERTDVTAVYVQSLRTVVEGMEARADALTEILGAEDLAQRMQRRRATIAAIESGLLKREVFVASTNE